MANSPYVIDVTAQDFYQLVLEGSHERPVLVDFWADWCAPCRSLAPVLEQLADRMRGKLLVAKVNTEEQQELAAQFGIRSLPTVKLFRNGQPVDEFMGALPESEVRAFVEKHLPRESDGLLQRAEALLAQGEDVQAADLVAQAAAMDPENSRVRIAQAQLKALQGELDEAEQLLNGLPLDEQGQPEVQSLRAQLTFAAALGDAPDVAVLEQRLAADPGDSEARYQLAAYRVMGGHYEAALEELLTLLKRDRGYGDDAARKAMVQIFELLGGSGELVSRYRGKMISALY
jgi:putative thioredoxin